MARLSRLGAKLFNLLDDVHALNDLTEDDVFTIELQGVSGSVTGEYLKVRKKDEAHPVSFSGGDEKLGSVGVRSGIGHGEKTRLGVFELEVFVSEPVGSQSVRWAPIGDTLMFTNFVP